MTLIVLRRPLVLSWRNLLWPRPLVARAVLYGVVGDFLSTAVGVALFGIGAESNTTVVGELAAGGLAVYALHKLLVLALTLAAWASLGLFDPSRSRVEWWARRIAGVLVGGLLWLELLVGLGLTVNNLAVIIRGLALGA